MAPYTASRSASTTPQSYISNPRTPSSSSKHRPVSLINRLVSPSPCLLTPALSSSDHPVEVVARIRDHPEGSDKSSVLQVLQNGQTVRVRTDQGYRDFGLDGVSLSEVEDLQSFYKKYVENRIEAVKLGGRCTIMMYGPTGAGKSHTMFGSSKEPGIAYRALQNILSGTNGSSENVGEKLGNGSPAYSVKKTRVIVTILEIYNEEIFDLLAGCPNTPNGHWTRPHMTRVRLEIMGKKAKNAVSISGTDAEKISKEIAKVEKRRVVKSTSCNERSSRSHCLVMLDVPALGGRLVLVDMAGSENLEQAGLGVDSKMQTGKINQGNVALKRVVEAIANGDSYIPFRDSKLTMLLQDSFEDDEAKILMILCASPDQKDIHKTVGTLEYGCKAKCIISLRASPAKEKSKGLDRTDSSVLEARVRAMDMQISKLEAENQSKDKEKEALVKQLLQKEQDLMDRTKALEQMERESKERCANCCNETRVEIENQIKECQQIAEEFITVVTKKLEEKVAGQHRQIEFMQSRMKEIEGEVELFMKTFSEALCIMDGDIVGKTKGSLANISVAFEENKERWIQSASLPHDSLAKKTNHDEYKTNLHVHEAQPPCGVNENLKSEAGETAQDGVHVFEQECYEPNGWLPAIPEESDGEEEMMADDEVDHQKLQRKFSREKVEQVDSQDVGVGNSLVSHHTLMDMDSSEGMEVAGHALFVDDCVVSHPINMDIDDGHTEGDAYSRSSSESAFSSYEHMILNPHNDDDKQQAAPMSAASRRSRIENIFLLCGNHRELAAVNTQKQSHEHVPTSHGERTLALVPKNGGVGRNPASSLYSKSKYPLSENTPPCAMMHSHSSPVSMPSIIQHTKSPSMITNFKDSFSPASEAILNKNSPVAELNADKYEVYVKWETSKESSGKLINMIKVKRNATLAELRSEVEKRVPEVKHDFTFLMLGDPSGAPIERDSEAHLQVSSLPDCHKQRGTKLACLRPSGKHNRMEGPLCAMENQMGRNSLNPKQATSSPSSKSPACYIPLRSNENMNHLVTSLH